MGDNDHRIDHYLRSECIELAKIIITGFSGFVSRYFLEYLENTGEIHQVKGIDKREPDFNMDHFERTCIDFEKNELSSKDEVERIIGDFRPDYILHLASHSSVSFSWEEPVESFLNNTSIFLNLIDAVRKLQLNSRILSIGSSEEYGNVNNGDGPLKEDARLNPLSPYAVARVSQEYISRVYVDAFDVDIVLTRSFNHIGPMQQRVFVVPSLARQLVEIKRSGKQKGTIVAGDVSIVRDFTDVRDVVRAYYLLLNKGRKGHVYNICSGTGLSIHELICMMAEQLNIEVDVRSDDHLVRLADNRKIVGSNEKIKRELGWGITIPLEQSLKDILLYWESNPN